MNKLILPIFKERGPQISYVRNLTKVTIFATVLYLTKATQKCTLASLPTRDIRLIAGLPAKGR